MNSGVQKEGKYDIGGDSFGKDLRGRFREQLHHGLDGVDHVDGNDVENDGFELVNCGLKVVDRQKLGQHSVDLGSGQLSHQALVVEKLVVE